jgi:hypothetical protein
MATDGDINTIQATSTDTIFLGWLFIFDSHNDYISKNWRGKPRLTGFLLSQERQKIRVIRVICG